MKSGIGAMACIERAVVRLQPAVSLALVAAVLVALVGVSWYRGMGPGSSDNGQPMAMIADEASPADVFQPECVLPDRETPTDDEIRAMDWGAWTSPLHSGGFSMFEGPTEIDATYTNFLACLFYPIADGTPVAEVNVAAFYSDRLRYLLMYDDLEQAQQAHIDAAHPFSPVGQMLDNLSLPVNAFPHAFGADPADVLNWPFIYAGDMLEFPDGRWAAWIGSVSFHMVQTGQPVRSHDGEIVYLAFVEQDGVWLIDEVVRICPNAFAPGAFDDGGPLDSAPFEIISPAEALTQGCAG
jgi:hypothetical protein